MDSWYKHGFMVQTWTHGIDKNTWYSYRLKVLTTPMVLTQTQGIDNTHGIDLDSWYKIGTPESNTYKRAKCYPYARFFDL